jgi:hypothetical protein
MCSIVVPTSLQTHGQIDMHTPLFIDHYFVPRVASKNILYLIGNYSKIIGSYVNVGNLLVIGI